jgi:hypothetical protein
MENSRYNELSIFRPLLTVVATMPSTKNSRVGLVRLARSSWESMNKSATGVGWRLLICVNGNQTTTEAGISAIA